MEGVYTMNKEIPLTTVTWDYGYTSIPWPEWIEQYGPGQRRFTAYIGLDIKPVTQEQIDSLLEMLNSFINLQCAPYGKPWIGIDKKRSYSDYEYNLNVTYCGNEVYREDAGAQEK